MSPADNNRFHLNIDSLQPDSPLRFALDFACWTHNAARTLTLTGWAIHPQIAVTGIRVVNRQNKKLAEIVPAVHRPGVAKSLPDYPGAARAGFRLEMPNPGKGRYALEAVMQSGDAVRFAEFAVRRVQRPRILFVHIPKTAGSSFNSWLSGKFSLGRCSVHVESQQRWWTDTEYFRNLDFISGHLTLTHFASRIDAPGYYCVTVVREPFAQLASHLAWIRKLADPGEEQRLRNHPEYIQSLSARLAEIDFTSADQLVSFVNGLEGVQKRLLSNCQLRYFASVDDVEEVQDRHLDQAISNSRLFSRIGRTEDTAGLVTAMARDLSWPEPGPLRRENVSTTRYGLEPNDPAIRSALEPLVRYDLRLLDQL